MLISRAIKPKTKNIRNLKGQITKNTLTSIKEEYNKANAFDVINQSSLGLESSSHTSVKQNDHDGSLTAIKMYQADSNS